jgi:hypothetical protein
MRGNPREAVEEPTEAAEEREPALPLAEVVVKRRRLELARIDVTHQLERAHVEAHREMLQRALRALDQELDRLI